MTFSPSQARDAHGMWTASNGAANPVVTQHAGQKSVHGKPAIGTYALGPGFTRSARTGRDITKGIAVAGAGPGAKAIGGGGGWQTERVNITREATLGKSLGRMRGQIAVYDLGKGEEIKTGGTTDPARAVTNRHKAA